MQTINTNILSEDFTVPDYNEDLSELIDACIDHFADVPKFQKERKDYKEKLNELIDTYNDRREMKIFNNVK